ncbi:hypothetical protein FACS189451_08910 [Bacteroidia bacterium]|nr:hypothetical protein FACS189451_08910 [Bacteroidia bacterium]
MKYLDLNGLNIFLGKIKSEITDEVENAVVGTTDAIVRNTLGDSQIDAASQKLLTDTVKTWDKSNW